MALYIPEIPPVLRGTEQEQIQALRDYLIRTTRTLSEILNGTGTGQLTGTGSGGTGTGGIQTGELAKVATTGEYTDLKNRPSLANVATSGLYSDLDGKPTLASVATTGSYNDLSNKPLGSFFAMYAPKIVGGYSNPGDTELAFEADPPEMEGFRAMGIIGFEWARTCAPLYPIKMILYVPGNKIQMKFGFFEPYQGARYDNTGVVYILYVRTAYPT